MLSTNKRRALAGNNPRNARGDATTFVVAEESIGESDNGAADEITLENILS